MTTEFNWSWVSTASATNKDSNSVPQKQGTIYSFTQAQNGQISASDLNSFVKSTAQNLQDLRSNWTTYIRPVLNSLPAGGRDNRWSSLSSKIDALTYGLQGTTLFVFNDATSSVADGRYWHSTDARPKTIAEVMEDMWDSISDLETSTSTSTSTSEDSLWAAIGEDYRDGTKVVASGSLDTRVTTAEGYIQHLADDIYTLAGSPYGLSQSLLYSVAQHLDALLKIHDISGGWQSSNPTNVGHSTISVGAHTQDADTINAAASGTLGRVASSNVEDDIQRLRYEVKTTRGSTAWNTDVTDPVTSSVGDLGTHIGYTSGTVSATNPHGIRLQDAYTALNTIAVTAGNTVALSASAAVNSTVFSATSLHTTSSNPVALFEKTSGNSALIQVKDNSASDLADIIAKDQGIAVVSEAETVSKVPKVILWAFSSVDTTTDTYASLLADGNGNTGGTAYADVESTETIRIGCYKQSDWTGTSFDHAWDANINIGTESTSSARTITVGEQGTRGSTLDINTGTATFNSDNGITVVYGDDTGTLTNDQFKIYRDSNLLADFSNTGAIAFTPESDQDFTITGSGTVSDITFISARDFNVDVGGDVWMEADEDVVLRYNASGASKTFTVVNALINSGESTMATFASNGTITFAPVSNRDFIVTCSGTGIIDTSSADIKLKRYAQDAEPTLTENGCAALWQDTNDSNKIYLVYRRGAADQVKIQLT